MPKVHRFFRNTDARAWMRDLRSEGLHLGIDLKDAAELFGPDWDRDARELGRAVRGLDLSVIARGPGLDLPVHTLDRYVADVVRACHDRALAIAMHFGAERYVVRMGSLHGLSRSERLARREAATRLLAELAANARARGLKLVVQQHLESDLDALELWIGTVASAGGGFVLSPARSLWAKASGLESFMDRVGSNLLGLDLTDFAIEDLEPRLPGTGILRELGSLRGLLMRQGLEFFCVDMNPGPSKDLVDALSRLIQPAEEPAAAQAAMDQPAALAR